MDRIYKGNTIIILLIALLIKKLMKKVILIGLLLIATASAQTVCSLDELVRELKEDISDNGKLDCLRVIRAPDEADEPEEKRASRLAAQWKSDCSFESESEGEALWMEPLIQLFGLKIGLVDVEGNPVAKDFDDQADMCEIIRALIGNGKFEGFPDDVTNISADIVEYVGCPGKLGQTQICAATSRSFADKKGWAIQMDAAAIQFGGKPKFNKAE